MKFGMEKCAMLVMKKGKIVKTVDIELPDGKVIKLLQEGQSYKYLGILGEDTLLSKWMKMKVSKQLRNDLRPISNDQNLVSGADIWTVSL